MRSIGRIGLMARVLGGLVFLFFMTFIVGEGILGGQGLNFAGATPLELAMIVLMVAAVLGIAIGFFWELAGGLVTTVCSLAWFAIELFGGVIPKSPGFQYWPFHLLLIAGVLFVVSGAKRCGNKEKRSDVVYPVM